MTKYRRSLRLLRRQSMLFLLFLCLLTMKGITGFESTGENVFHVAVNGIEIGTVADPETAEKMLKETRRELAAQSDNMIFMEAELSVWGEELLYGTIDEEALVKEKMTRILEGEAYESRKTSYTVKMKDYMANLQSKEEVEALLQAVLQKYDPEEEFSVSLVPDPGRELEAMTTLVQKKEEDGESGQELFLTAGFSSAFSDFYEQSELQTEKDFDDYVYGITRMDFTEKVEVVEAYLPSQQLTGLQAAIDELTMEQENKTVYKVVAGDTLSEIAIKVNIPMERIVELNDSLESISTTLQIDQELIVTVTEPEVSVQREEICYYEEIYDAPVVYIDRDDWYTNQSNVIQQPSAGFRKITAQESYVNEKLVSREILKQEVVMEAVEKIVERGTKIPPTYIKPISGGRKTSGFGKRKAPKPGASTYHKGVDWAVPTGTAVYASCGGKVAKAGWGSGYGYVIYINHEDGRQTRYGHLSKILVSVGDKVKQGEKIALSGNTGVSTGPHLHFEILIDGTQVNPLNYLD